MALSSAPTSVFNNHRFRVEFNQTLFESIVRRKKVTPEVGFNLDEDEYPQIKEQIALRGWRRLAAPMTEISKLLVQEFYANTAVSDEEMEHVEQLPYKSYVSGVEVDFSPENIRRDAKVPLREFKRTTWIPQEKPITAKRMESTRLPRNVPPQQQDEDDEDQPMPQAEGGNEADQNQQQYHQFQQPLQQHYPDFQ
ncbi:hypothetical protein PIB30_071807 [Stylosanthes scabra]|uniref:Uncharacterized protein n=1 Tax=Stylosanthes scabra TaxID=79078 RepID=A0ABU6QPJ6_9FABA|nr:hypothetical protein [Stylosanthes scabra]